MIAYSDLSVCTYLLILLCFSAAVVGGFLEIDLNLKDIIRQTLYKNIMLCTWDLSFLVLGKREELTLDLAEATQDLR